MSQEQKQNVRKVYITLQHIYNIIMQHTPVSASTTINNIKPNTALFARKNQQNPSLNNSTEVDTATAQTQEIVPLRPFIALRVFCTFQTSAGPVEKTFSAK